jgi:hypothetical protein
MRDSGFSTQKDFSPLQWTLAIRAKFISARYCGLIDNATRFYSNSGGHSSDTVSSQPGNKSGKVNLSLSRKTTGS